MRECLESLRIVKLGTYTEELNGSAIFDCVSAIYSLLSLCGQPAITDTPLLRTGAKSSVACVADSL